MTREEKINLLNELLEYEEKNDIGILTRADRREFQQWVNEALEQEPTTKNDLPHCQCTDAEIAKSFLEDVEAVKDQLLTTKNDLGVDCISRQAVIGELKRYFHDKYYQRTSIQDCRDCFIEDVLNHLPSVTPQEPKTGHWIVIDDCELFMAKCSECGEVVDSRLINKYPYCHCGAKMFEPQESEDNNGKID